MARHIRELKAMAMINRRSFSFALAATGGAALLPRATRAELAEITTAARKEGVLTWYVAQVD
jgi:hypothetical protein